VEAGLFWYYLQRHDAVPPIRLLDEEHITPIRIREAETLVAFAGIEAGILMLRPNRAVLSSNAFGLRQIPGRGVEEVLSCLGAGEGRNIYGATAYITARLV